LAGAREGDVKHEYRTGLHIDYSSRRLTELDRAFPPEELSSALVNEADAYRMHADFRAPAADPEHQVSAGIYRGEVGEPNMLKHAQHAELALLVYQGVVRDDSEIEMQVTLPGWT
jgi:hypothetical protein